MPARLRRLLTAGLAVALVTTVAAACSRAGGDDPARRPRAVVGAAPDLTVAAGPARIVAAAGLASLEVAVDLETGRGAGVAVAAALGRPDGVPVAVDYGRARRGEAAAAVDAAPVVGALPAELVGAGLQPGNPLAALELLRAAAEVEAYGGQVVRGVATHRYSVRIDPSAVAGGAALGDEPVPAEVWVDGKGRVRRLQLGRDLRVRTTTTDGQGLLSVTTIDFVAFEVPLG